MRWLIISLKWLIIKTGISYWQSVFFSSFYLIEIFVQLDCLPCNSNHGLNAIRWHGRSECHKKNKI